MIKVINDHNNGLISDERFKELQELYFDGQYQPRTGTETRPKSIIYNPITHKQETI